MLPTSFGTGVITKGNNNNKIVEKQGLALARQAFCKVTLERGIASVFCEAISISFAAVTASSQTALLAVTQCICGLLSSDYVIAVIGASQS